MQQTKIILDENDIPKKWYNILPDMPTPLSLPLNPATKEPVGPKDLAPLFPMELLFNLSGHGHFDMGAYDSYFSGTMKDSD